MTKVLVAEPFPPALVGRLRAMLPVDVDVEVVATLRDEDFARAAADADIVVCARRPVDGRLLRLAPKVRLIHQLGIGYDNLDVDAIAAAGIAAAYNPGFNSISVAEHTIMLMLVLLRRFPAADAVTRAGRFPTMEFIEDHQARMAELGTLTVGLVGLGTIGEAVAERLAGFGCRLVYAARHRHGEGVEARLALQYLSFAEVLASCDLLSLHVPLNPETRHLVGDTELASMGPGSYLVNTSRGQVVDGAALRRAIGSGHLAGAAIDVLEDELSAANPFAGLPNVIVTPHVAGTSRTSLPRALEMTAANIGRFRGGEPLHNPVPGTTTVD
jgi:phosphoglycerate dehydrogenase-like enzyme